MKTQWRRDGISRRVYSFTRTRRKLFCYYYNYFITIAIFILTLLRQLRRARAFVLSTDYNRAYVFLERVQSYVHAHY